MFIIDYRFHCIVVLNMKNQKGKSRPSVLFRLSLSVFFFHTRTAFRT